jgi:hypothetical protein
MLGNLARSSVSSARPCAAVHHQWGLSGRDRLVLRYGLRGGGRHSGGQPGLYGPERCPRRFAHYGGGLGPSQRRLSLLQRNGAIGAGGDSRIVTPQSPVTSGGSFSYVLAYHNGAASALSSAQLSLPVPVGASFVSADGGGALGRWPERAGK